MEAAKCKPVSCGRDLVNVPDLPTVLESAGNDGFDFVSTYLVHPRYKRDLIKRKGYHGCNGKYEPLTRNDLVMPSSDWMSLIVAKVSPWIRVDNENKMIRTNSEKALLEECGLAQHLNVPVVMVPLRSGQCVNLARCLGTLTGQSKGNQSFWLQVPLTDERASVCGKVGVVSQEDPWEWWNKLRMLCGKDKKLSIALVIGETIPSSALLDKWFGEPIKAVVVPTSIFVINKKGFPVLRRSHQEIFKRLFKLDVQLLLSGSCKVDTGIQSYYQYLDHMYQTRPPLTGMDLFARGYNDYLQNPLQPLMDNLDSHTYEIFEKDPVKYREYERAIHLALIDRVPEEVKYTFESVIMVVGAGRGPLVRASLAAAKSSQRIVKVFAVEKNPGAIVTLRNLQFQEWGDQVTVVSSDMRELESIAIKADIIVSELLGSFGDNELSPECLDGVQKFLKEDGISIPSSYNSYLAPVLAHKLHTSIEDCKDHEKGYCLSHYETPYVVRIWNATPVSDIQKCFTFHHPNNDDPIDNNRYVCLKFKCNTSNTLVHGLAGYFDTVLYKDVMLSIHPETHSDGMISWFPIFFPFKEPVYVTSEDTIELHVWRLSNGKYIWYEWGLTAPIATSIHNPRGRSYWIGL